MSAGALWLTDDYSGRTQIVSSLLILLLENNVQRGVRDSMRKRVGIIMIFQIVLHRHAPSKCAQILAVWDDIGVDQANKLSELLLAQDF